MFCLKCGEKIPENSSFCMFCGTPISLNQTNAVFDDESIDLPKRYCNICGRELPETGVGDICVTCLYNGSFVADQIKDDSYQETYFTTQPDTKTTINSFNVSTSSDDTDSFNEDTLFKRLTHTQDDSANSNVKHWPKRIILVSIVLLIIIASTFLLFRLHPWSGINGTNSDSSNPNTSLGDQKQNRDVYMAAQSMVKSKAAYPESVHFDMKTLSVKEENGVYTVKQSFERKGNDGSMISAEYVAMLTLDLAASNGYKPIMLQVDDGVLYDYR